MDAKRRREKKMMENERAEETGVGYANKNMKTDFSQTNDVSERWPKTLPINKERKKIKQTTKKKIKRSKRKDRKEK